MILEDKLEEIDQKLSSLEQTISEDYEWLKELVLLRIGENSNFNSTSEEDIENHLNNFPNLSERKDIYSKIVHQQNWTAYDRVIVLLGLSSTLEPELLIPLHSNSKIKKQLNYTDKPSELIPAFKDAFYILFGAKYLSRIKQLQLLNDGYHLFRSRILEKKSKEEQGIQQFGLLDQTISITEEFLYQISTGKEYEPNYSSSFPAKKVSTEYGWEDLLLNKKVLDQVQTMVNWVANLEHIKTYSSLKKSISGYKAILYGPPGTGKSMTVKILGKELKRIVYRIDLSQVVSKYVGETEKNLSKVFDLARDRNWILFFDEGDALFGKRGSSNSSQDRYANQEVAYLLQRMEEHNGVVLLATNKMRNLDEAFLRRFQTQIYFPNPDEQVRLILWNKAYSEDFKLEDPSILKNIANKYVVSPAQIINAKNHSIVKTLADNKKVVPSEYVLEGLSLELQKSNKTL